MTQHLPATPPLVAEHDTWISADPILGCPAACDYCYLGPLDLRARRQTTIVTADELVVALMQHLGDRSDRTPVCIGNHTDMFLHAEGRQFLREVVPLLRDAVPERPICVVTKGRLGRDDARLAGDHDLLVFMSQSFVRDTAPSVEKGPVASPDDTLAGATYLADAGVPPIHFWRPFLAAFNRPEAIEGRIDRLAASGFASSVVIGLKAIRHLVSTSMDIWLSAEDREVPGDERLPLALWEIARAAAEAVGHPMYRNTSCAIAHRTAAPEMLGTWREPFLTERCAPSVCPRTQRERCLAQAEADVEFAELRRRIDPFGANRTIRIDGRKEVSIDGAVDEFSYNTIVHVTGARVIAGSVVPQKAWLGAFADRSPTCQEDDVKLAPAFAAVVSTPELRAAIARLEGIAGFVTTLEAEGDPRARVFNRLRHVERVVSLAERLSGAAEGLDRAKVRKIAWLHDVNRWVFAHNAEKGYFDQVAAVESFYGRFQESAGLCDDLRAFHGREHERLSPEARCALIADLTTGLIEDPLLAVVGLNVDPGLIPDSVARSLNIPFDSAPLRSVFREGAHLLHFERDIGAFDNWFAQTFTSCLNAFNRRHPIFDAYSRVSIGLFDLAAGLKDHFLRPIIFPINNERVCHGEWIKTRVVEPGINGAFGDPRRFCADLITKSEEEFVTWLGGCERFDLPVGPFFPDLDVVLREEPGMAFVKAPKT